MITIYGASDDLVEVEGCIGADEFNVHGSGKVLWRADLIAPDGGRMRVHAICDGCWHIAVGQVDEDVELPDWPLTIRQGRSDECRYSAVLEIDAPPATRIRNVEPSGA